MSHHNGGTVSDVRLSWGAGGGDVHFTGQQAAAQRVGEAEGGWGGDLQLRLLIRRPLVKSRPAA